MSHVVVEFEDCSVVVLEKSKIIQVGDNDQSPAAVGSSCIVLWSSGKKKLEKLID